jgi:hypothetical protein
VQRNGSYSLRRSLAGVGLLTTLILFTGCNGAQLNPLQEGFFSNQLTGTANISFCTSPPTPATVEVDYFFMVDVSGSNHANCMPDSSGTGNCLEPITIVAGTNPQGLQSFGAINSFLTEISQIPANNNLNYYALIEFSTQPSLVQALTSNLSEFQGVIQNQLVTLPFEGWTDYEDTITMLQSQVQNIINTEANNAAQHLPTRQHVIETIFTTDGAPLVLGSSNLPVLQNSTQIINEISSLETLVSQNAQYILSLQFNAIYYYINNIGDSSVPADLQYSSYYPVAVQTLQSMTQAGFGNFYDDSQGQVPNYSSFLVPPVNEINQLADIFVFDMNTQWVGPNLVTATDGRMADQVRSSLGAPTSVINSGSPDSDSNGVSDLAEYLTTGKICNDPKCNPANATNYAKLAQCKDFLVSNTKGVVTFSHELVPDSIFNDCELTAMNANIDGTDTLEGTTVPQDLAAVMQHPISVTNPVDWLFSSPFEDQYTGEERLKFNVSPFVNSDLLVGYQPYVYELNLAGQPNPLQNCYNLTVSDITLSSLPQDNIRVYLFQTGVSSNLTITRVGSKMMPTNTGTVTFVDSDLK